MERLHCLLSDRLAARVLVCACPSEASSGSVGGAPPHRSGARDRSVLADSHTEWVVGPAKRGRRSTMASLAVARQRRCPVFRPFRDEPARSVVVYYYGPRRRRESVFSVCGENVGSLTALVLYPLVLESMLGISWQTRIWSIGYAAFIPLILGCAWLAWNSKPVSHAVAVSHSAGGTHTWVERGTWVLLAFVPSSLMLGVTTNLSISSRQYRCSGPFRSRSTF